MTAPRRRWSYSLRTLFVVVTVLAMPLGYVAWQWRVVRVRRELLGWINEHGKSTSGPHPHLLMYDAVEGRSWAQPKHLPYVRGLLGDTLIYAFWLPDAATEDIRQSFIKAFPEASVAPLERNDWSVAPANRP